MNKEEDMAMRWMAGWMLIFCSLVFLICYFINPLFAILSTISFTILGWMYIFSAINYIKNSKGVGEKNVK